MAATVVDFIVDNLKQILSYGGNSEEKAEMESLYEDLQFIRSFLTASDEINNEHNHIDEIKMLAAQIRRVACEALNSFDISVVFARRQMDCSFDFSTKRKTFMQEIMLIKKQVIDIYSNNLYGVEGLSLADEMSASFQNSSSPHLEEEEIVVGFDDEGTKIMERLVADKKNLEVISIVGMAGIGKTTLARKVYNDPVIVHRFYIRAWTYVSQVYQKRDLLIRILSCFVEKEDEIRCLSEERLAETLYKSLKGQKYLIIVDDIWNIEGWQDLKRSFPDDNNGSRIMLTTRLKDLALRVKLESPPHVLSLLSGDESWDLLQKKAFREGTCPFQLMDIGKQIAEKCGGLPLAIVVVGGILARNEKNQEFWKEFYEGLISSESVLGDETEKFMDILAFSYNHLPTHLKSCFLYFAAFPEDYEIPAWRLIWLWIAEGFVKQSGNRSFEDLAGDYLTDLINGCLVMIVNRSSCGGIKSCRIHDMLRNLCLRLAKKRNVLQEIDWFRKVASPSSPIFDARLCFHSHGFHTISGSSCEPNVQSFFYCASSSQEVPRPKLTTFIYKLLRVLDLRYILLTDFPLEILHLFQLKYLELHVHSINKLPSQISNLWSLETLIIDKEEWERVIFPRSIWNMVRLRHIRISDEIIFEEPSTTENSDSALLENLQSISPLPLCEPGNDGHTKFVLARTPMLRKLTLYRDRDKWGEYCFPDLGKSSHLEKLKLVDNTGDVIGQRVHPPCKPLRIPQPSNFPPYLKKLTLSGGYVHWKEISKLGKLPNLQILKLRRNSFSGQWWETSEGEFPQLKFLKLSWMDLQKWSVTSPSHFPRLERLALQACMNLEEVPSCLGDVPTLQTIEISWSSRSASKSAMIIQEEQHNLGNDELKVSIFPIEVGET